MTINKGSKEYMIVNVRDRIESISDLSTLTPTFFVEDENGNSVVASTPATADGLRLKCLIDTTVSAFVIGGNYNLYVAFDVSPEAPQLGPVEFGVA